MVRQPLHQCLPSPNRIGCRVLSFPGRLPWNTSDVATPEAIIKATVPATWGEAMDVPFGSRYPLASHSSQFPVGTVEFIANSRSSKLKGTPCA